jgi:hypothetical protein
VLADRLDHARIRIWEKATSYFLGGTTGGRRGPDDPRGYPHHTQVMGAARKMYTDLSAPVARSMSAAPAAYVGAQSGPNPPPQYAKPCGTPNKFATWIGFLLAATFVLVFGLAGDTLLKTLPTHIHSDANGNSSYQELKVRRFWPDVFLRSYDDLV